MQRYVGIDIGGTNIKFGIFLNDGRLEKKWSISTDFSDEGKKMCIRDRLFDDIECNAFVGNLGQGLLLARHNFYNDYDIIISRGGTASMLKSQLDIPVIEIETSPLDVLRAMRVGGNVSETCTVIGFPNIISNVDTICQLMKTQINTLSINDKSEVENLLKTVPSTGDHMVIGDMIAYTTALKLSLIHISCS